MEKYGFLILALATLSILGCQQKDTDGSINMKVVATYQGQPVNLGETYSYTNGEPVIFTLLNFFVADLSLVSGANETRISEITHVKLEDVGSGARFSTTFENITPGTYDGYVFDLGVPERLNMNVPETYSSDSPLSDSFFYWEAWDSYIFAKIEGRMDNDADPNFEVGIAYHTGTERMFREGTPNLTPIAIVEGETTDLTFHVELEDIFENVDVPLEPFSHTTPGNPESISISNRVSDGLLSAIQLQ